jgi:hypothetical protein
MTLIIPTTLEDGIAPHHYHNHHNPLSQQPRFSHPTAAYNPHYRGDSGGNGVPVYPEVHPYVEPYAGATSPPYNPSYQKGNGSGAYHY